MSLIKNLLLYFSLILAFAYGLYGLVNPISFEYDLGRHLLFGKIMLESHDIINTNLISYTNTNFNYVNSHWLSEIFFYLINQFMGNVGLMLFTAFTSILTVIILYIFTYKRVPLSAVAITLPIYLSFLIFRIDVRPEIFSYLFISIFVIVLFKFREKYTKLIYILIPILALWVNLHIYFAVGLFLIALFLVEEFFINNFKINRNVKVLFVILTLSILVSFFNPNFVKGVLFPITVFSNYSIPIQENLNFFSLAKNYNFFTFLPHLTLILSAFLLLMVYRKKASQIELFLLFIFGFSALIIFRNFFIFLIISFYPFSRLLGFLLDGIEKKLKKLVNKLQLEILKSISYFFLSLIIISLILMQYFLGNLVGYVNIERGKPALDFFIKNELKGPIYNSFDLGQYIAYRLYPKELVFVDARPEAYPEAFLKDNYSASAYDPKLFEVQDKKYKFNSFIIYLSLYSDPPIMNYLIENNNYKLIYLDTYSMIFIKNNDINRKLINKYSISENTFKLKGNEDIQILSKYVLIFDEIGWNNAENYVFEKLLKKDKNACLLKNLLNQRPIGAQKLNYSHIKISNTKCN